MLVLSLLDSSSWVVIGLNVFKNYNIFTGQIIFKIIKTKASPQRCFVINRNNFICNLSSNKLLTGILILFNPEFSFCIDFNNDKSN